MEKAREITQEEWQQERWREIWEQIKQVFDDVRRSIIPAVERDRHQNRTGRTHHKSELDREGNSKRSEKVRPPRNIKKREGRKK